MCIVYNSDHIYSSHIKTLQWAHPEVDVQKIDVPDTNLAQLNEESLRNDVDICALCGEPATSDRGYEHMTAPPSVTAPPQQNFDGNEAGYNDRYNSAYRDGYYSGNLYTSLEPATASNSHWLWFLFGAVFGFFVSRTRK